MTRVFAILMIFLTTLPSVVATAQHQELTEKPAIWKLDSGRVKAAQKDMLSAFKNGHVSGHFRNFFMATNNQSGLSDYYANAIGGGIRFETAPFHHIQFAVSGFYSYNIGSSDLSQADNLTGQNNRFEIGLFDIEDPSNKRNLAKLEELNLNYSFRKVSVTFGNQLINTPFINLQDGRMRPTVVQGIWSGVPLGRKIKLELGYFYGISPRSTFQYYSMGSSIGVYPMGVNTDGSKSNYYGHVQSDGVILGTLHYRPNSGLYLQLWEQTVTGMFHTAMLQADYTIRRSAKGNWTAAFQSVTQLPIRDGGNADPGKTYYNGNQSCWTFGGKLAWTGKRVDASVNYNRITMHGRYLMPREWGRDPFFTFMPRERNEGFGDVHAFMGKLGFSFPARRFKASLAAGYFQLPDVKNYRLNKYGMPSYAQVNLDVRYELKGLLKPLEIQCLYVYKAGMGETYNNPKFVFNKVDMSQFNLVMNYRF